MAQGPTKVRQLHLRGEDKGDSSHDRNTHSPEKEDWMLAREKLSEIWAVAPPVRHT